MVLYRSLALFESPADHLLITVCVEQTSCSEVSKSLLLITIHKLAKEQCSPEQKGVNSLNAGHRFEHRSTVHNLKFDEFVWRPS